jgi:hypothetical protein
MLKIGSSSSKQGDKIWPFKSQSSGYFQTHQCYKCEYVDNKNNLNVSDLLKDLKITCTRLNKDELLKIWEFMVSQSKTCLQGSSFYSFNFFVKEIIKSYEGKSLNSPVLWKNICKKIYIVFRERKEKAVFENDGKYFSLRMFSTNKKFSEDQINSIILNNIEDMQTTETEAAMMVEKSIDYHFYHFGDEDSPSVIKFNMEASFYHLSRIVLQVLLYGMTFLAHVPAQI